MTDPTRAALPALDWVPLLLKVKAAYGSDAFRQKGKAPVMNPRAIPLIERCAEAGLLEIDYSELPMMANGPRVTIAPGGFFASLTAAGEAALRARAEEAGDGD